MQAHSRSPNDPLRQVNAKLSKDGIFVNRTKLKQHLATGEGKPPAARESGRFAFVNSDEKASTLHGHDKLLTSAIGARYPEVQSS